MICEKITAGLCGKVTIAAGAASGIGKATTELLHQRGAKIIAVGRGSNVEALAKAGIVSYVGDDAKEETASGPVEPP